MAMIGNNLSTLGVSAAQLDNIFNTTSLMLQWLPTTGEFGLYGTFGDFDHHEKLATRLAAHYTHSREDRQSQPGSNSIENSQIRLTDGNTIFTPDLFGPGITVEKVDYDMVSLDGGLKKKGFSLEAEYYWRFLGDYAGPNTGGIEDIDDHGFQVQASAMAIPKTAPGVRGRRGDPRCLRQRSELRRGRELLPHEGARPPAERGVAAPRQLPGGLHGRALSGGRERRRLPPQLRAELLMRGPGWRRAGRDRGPAGPAGRAGRAAAGAPGYVVNDSHFHLTNYVQEGTDIRDFVAIMGDKVGRVALFGIPLQQTWSHGNTGDYAPTYYLQTDAPLYYYSFTDASIAMAYRSLPPAQQARFDPMITGFNPADMYAAAHIERVLRTFPGVFSGIGEFTVHKEFVSSKVAGETASLVNPALDRILDFAGEVGLVVILHNDVDVPFPKAGQDSYQVAQLGALFRRHPKTTIIWAHCGLGRIVRPVKDQLALVERALADPALAHVSIDISWDEVAKYVLSTPETTQATADLVNRYPDRFVFGTDEVAPKDQQQYLKVYDMYAPLFAKLTPEASEKVRKGNYERLFDEARRRVRAWEKAHVL